MSWHMTHDIDHQNKDWIAALAEHPDTRLLTRDEVAQVFGLPKRWLEIAACQGTGPPIVRITRKMVRYRFRDVEAWIEAHVDFGDT